MVLVTRHLQQFHHHVLEVHQVLGACAVIFRTHSLELPAECDDLGGGGVSLRFERDDPRGHLGERCGCRLVFLEILFRRIELLGDRFELRTKPGGLRRRLILLSLERVDKLVSFVDRALIARRLRRLRLLN